MKTLDAGPAGVRQPGTVVEVDDAEGQALVAGGYADVIEAPVKKAAPKAAKQDKEKSDKSDGEADASPGAGSDPT